MTQTAAFEQRRLDSLKELEAAKAALDAQYTVKTDKLKEVEAQLEARTKQIDDRDNTHVRRELRLELQRHIARREEKFSLSEGTNKLRLPIHIALIVLIVGLGVLNLYFLTRFTVAAGDLTANIWLLVKQGLLAATLIAAILFYIRWMNSWFVQHASAEFVMKQLQLDIDRASWAVETALAWRREQQSDIPSNLLDGITKNLFASETHAHTDTTAADDLASALLGSASTLKLKVGENEINMDRKGIAKLAKTEIKVD